MSNIHPMAFVDPTAQIGRDVVIAPFCHVGVGVTLGDGCRLYPHVTLTGPTTFGKGNVFFPNCAIGTDPQDLKFKGGPTQLLAGDDNIFRESVTVHRGTETDRRSAGVTRIGNNNLFMVGVHVAHDSDIGDHVILANNVLVAGHVRIENCVNVGGAAGIHNFVTIGRNAFIGGMTRVTHDVPPYVKVLGYDQNVRGLNTEGLRRWKFSPESIEALKTAFRLIYPRAGGRAASRTAEGIRDIRTNGLNQDEHVRYLADFLQRKLDIGVFGRAREAARTDVPADRGKFYHGNKQPEAS